MAYFKSNQSSKDKIKSGKTNGSQTKLSLGFRPKLLIISSVWTSGSDDHYNFLYDHNLSDNKYISSGRNGDNRYWTHVEPIGEFGSSIQSIDDDGATLNLSTLGIEYIYEYIAVSK